MASKLTGYPWLKGLFSPQENVLNLIDNKCTRLKGYFNETVYHLDMIGVGTLRAKRSVRSVAKASMSGLGQTTRTLPPHPGGPAGSSQKRD